jgi:hypothetical protein
MAVGMSIFELHLPQARSLKDKRKIVKSLVDRIHRRYRVSVAETDLHDLHQRSELSIAAVGRSDGEVEKLLESLRRLIEEEPAAILTLWSPQILCPAELAESDAPWSADERS